MADFSGMDPIIYREPLQTEQYDSMSLNGEFLLNPPETVLHIDVCSPRFRELHDARGLRLLLLQGDFGGVHQLREGECPSIIRRCSVLHHATGHMRELQL